MTILIYYILIQSADAQCVSQVSVLSTGSPSLHYNYLLTSAG